MSKLTELRAQNLLASELCCLQIGWIGEWHHAHSQGALPQRDHRRDSMVPILGPLYLFPG